MKYSTEKPNQLKNDSFQYICLTYDDNMYSGLPASKSDGGVNHFLELFSTKKNNDGSPIFASFFIKTQSFDGTGPDKPEFVKEVLVKALQYGHELASHTHTHPHGIEVDWEGGIRKPILSKDQWKKEIEISLGHLKSIGVQNVMGFRTPYLEYNSEVFKALKELGIKYDSSIDEGWQDNLNAGTGVWPYDLQGGSPGEAFLSEKTFKSKPLIDSLPGLVEIPTAVLTLPPDELCEKYGTLPGLRKKIQSKSLNTALPSERILSFDWNWYWQYSMTEDEIVATICYNLDERRGGNRSPLIISGHTDYYSPRYDNENVDATWQAKCVIDIHGRRRIWERFIDFAVKYSDVKFTNLEKLYNKLI